MPKAPVHSSADDAAVTRVRGDARHARDGGADAGASDAIRQPASRPTATLLGRYRVIEARGAGGFGAVLICWDTLLQRRVAIKRIPVAVPGGSATTMAAALAEARTSSLLAHPGIVTVYDFQSDADYAYLVMEYVDGLTLAELMQRVEGGRLTPDEACFVARSLADALAFAHANGVLHLDIKPTNVMINSAGVVKLCDFGMATLASAAGYGGARGGTVGYMPPEQVEGGLVDERTDVFSLAVVVWQMLAGASPFAASTPEASLRLMEKGARRRISRLVPEAAPVDEVMAAALAPEPSARTTSVEAFAADLERGLGDAARGGRSIAALLGQATDDEVDEEGLASELPLAFRFPWLAPLVVRGTSAILAAGVAVAPLRHVLADMTPAAPYAALAVVAALSALWPATGSLLASGTLLLALARPPVGAAAIMLPGVAGVALMLWWLLVGRGASQSTAALLVPTALSAPTAAPAIAGAYLPPVRAAITTVGAWLLAETHATAIASGFVASTTAHALVSTVGNPFALARVGAAALAAAVVAALTRRTSSVAAAVGAQVLGAVLLVAAQLAVGSMENGGNVVAPSWSGVGVAVVLCTIMGAVYATCGVPANEEGAHELH